MARIACLWVRDLPLAALLRVEPELRGLPVALTDGRAPDRRVVALSPAARAAGIVSGMRAVQARAGCTALVLRPTSAEALHAAAAALADVAATFTPLVEVCPDGTVYGDCTASAGLCVSEAELATILGARAEHQGLPAFVGIAGAKVTARIAAREGRGVRIVRAAETRAYLAPLPVALLDADERLKAALARWGIRRIGDLAALPSGAVAHRLGPGGARLARQARGEDDAPLRCRPTPESFVELAELDYGVEQLEPLLFLLRRLVDRMTGRLALHGHACGALELRLHLEGGGRDVRHVAVAAPTSESAVLFAVARAHLEQRLPVHPVTGLAVSGTPGRVRPVQLDFFQPRGPAPAALAATMARLALLCGPDRVGMPRAADSHRPGVIVPLAFAAEPTSARDGASVATSRSKGGSCFAGEPTSAGDDAGPHGAGTCPPPSPDVGRVALRAFRPPVPLEVFESCGHPGHVRGRGLGGRVLHLAGPWRLCGEWWTTDPYAREYYDVELSDGGVYRIYRDVRARCWLADGVYD